MSHTIGQAKQDKQQSNFNSSEAVQDSQQPESTTLEAMSRLSDADYEFLFNQLLEGIAHGWHDRRIIKFFQQLGDRGKPSDWVAWLDRVRVKLLKLPIQSKRQLGTMMIRLGELTQSATEVDQIGAASNRIGRELLFGNTQAIVWEYDGPDLVPEASDKPHIETEQELSERLPTDFEALGHTEVEETKPNLMSEFLKEATESDANDLDSSALVDSTSDNSDETVNSTLELELETNLGAEKIISSETKIETVTSVPEIKIDPTDLNQSRNDSKELEFELPEEKLEAVTKSVDNLIELPVNQQEIVESELESEGSLGSAKPELSDAIEALDDVSTNPPLSNELDLDPVAIDIQQVMHLIQEDNELAQQISQKLNVSDARSQNIGALEETDTTVTEELDESSLELIESWFNLGLKQVSAGEFSQAISSWEKALNINPNLSEAWHNRGSALGRLGDYEAAVESFQSALTIDPDNYQAWNDRAHALYQLQNWVEAVNSWSNAIKIMPGNHLFWYNRGCALEQLEKWQDAIASYEKALEIKPDFQLGRSRYINLVADNSRPN